MIKVRITTRNGHVNLSEAATWTVSKESRVLHVYPKNSSFAVASFNAGEWRDVCSTDVIPTPPRIRIAINPEDLSAVMSEPAFISAPKAAIREGEVGALFDNGTYYYVTVDANAPRRTIEEIWEWAEVLSGSGKSECAIAFSTSTGWLR